MFVLVPNRQRKFTSKAVRSLTGISVALLLVLMPLSKVRAVEANLITNPSVETSANTTAPDGWSYSQWGTNTATNSYLNNDAHEGTQSIKTEVTAYTDGAANWFTDMPVTAGSTYKFSMWYKSNVDTTVEVETISGTTRTWNAVLGTASASPSTWTQFATTYTVPAGATAISIYQPLNKVGWTIEDDFSLTAYTPTAFSSGMVSVTLDDGWTNQTTNGQPILTSLGLPATYYIISDEVKDATPVDGAEYMSRAQVLALSAINGNEIGSHTKDHCELTTGLTEPGGPACPGFNLASEMQDSKAVLEGIVGAGKVNNFAYPYGSYNATTIAAGNAAGYTSQRSVVRGFNSIDSWDVTALKGQEVDTTTTNAEVQAWIDQAKAQHTWLILIYHEVANAAAQGDAGYNVTPANFQAQMNYLKNSGLPVKSVRDALATLAPQVVITPPATKPGDVNGDNAIDALDLSTLLSNWSKTGAAKAQGDLNGDGVVDALDLSTLLTNWGK